MQLLSLKTGGVLRWEGLENDFASELALDLDEDAENVAITLQYLLSCGLAVTDDNTAFFLPYVESNTGSEGSSAERMRNLRGRHSNVTLASQCDTAPVTMCAQRYGEIDIDIEIDKEKEYIRKRKPTQKAFIPPTLEEVKAYITEKGYDVDPEFFYDYYKDTWTDSEGKPVRNWKQKVITWAKGGRKGNGKPVSGNAQTSAETGKQFTIHYDNESFS